MKSVVYIIKFTVIAVVVAVTVCCSTEDKYLRTLPLEVEVLNASDSINIDRFELFQSNEVVRIDDNWLLIAATKGDYRLLFVNVATSEHFFAIRKGRGPGEMLDGGSLHKCGNDALLYCMKTATCIRIFLEESVDERKAVYDTVGVFKSSVSKPAYMTSVGKNGFVSGNMADPNVWYSLYDREGNILSSVEALSFEELSQDYDDLVSFHMSCKYASNPAGTKVCVASVASPSLSFADIDSGILKEYKRSALPPIGMIESRLRPDHTSAFVGVAADDEYVYVIYSGHKLFDDVLPTDECRHLIIYDWKGTPVRHYLLNHSISSIHVDGKAIYGTSTYPESCVYKFCLPN